MSDCPKWAKSTSSMSRWELQHPFTRRISSFLGARMSPFIFLISCRSTFSASATQRLGRQRESPAVQGTQIQPQRQAKRQGQYCDVLKFSCYTQNTNLRISCGVRMPSSRGGALLSYLFDIPLQNRDPMAARFPTYRTVCSDSYFPFLIINNNISLHASLQQFSSPQFPQSCESPSLPLELIQVVLVHHHVLFLPVVASALNAALLLPQDLLEQVDILALILLPTRLTAIKLSQGLLETPLPLEVRKTHWLSHLLLFHEMLEDQLAIGLSSQLYIVVCFELDLPLELSYVTVPVEFPQVGMPQCLKGSKPLGTAKAQQMHEQIKGLLITCREDLLGRSLFCV